tara:strand:+ start:193 stop:804 length:612 start_codon:yes stop_codon:yes gene_type:complete
MEIGLVVGSHRKYSQSAKVAEFCSDFLRDKLNVSTWTLDLGQDPLPFWDEELAGGESHWAGFGQLAQQLSASDAFVFVSPEWHGMVPAALKNFFLIWSGTDELAHKPALACAVSAGEGGAYVINELRTSSYKNSRLCWLPEHIIARQVHKICNADPSENDSDANIRFVERCQHSLRLLTAYARALENVRDEGFVEQTKFPNGM